MHITASVKQFQKSFFVQVFDLERIQLFLNHGFRYSDNLVSKKNGSGRRDGQNLQNIDGFLVPLKKHTTIIIQIINLLYLLSHQNDWIQNPVVNLFVKEQKLN